MHINLPMTSFPALLTQTHIHTRLIRPSSWWWWWWWQVVRKRRSYHCHFRVLSPAEATRVDLISKIVAILSFWSDLNVSTHMVKGKGGAAAAAEEASLFLRPPPNCFPLSIRPLLILSLFSFFSGHCWVRSLASSSSSNRSTLLCPCTRSTLEVSNLLLLLLFIFVAIAWESLCRAAERMGKMGSGQHRCGQRWWWWWWWLLAIVWASDHRIRAGDTFTAMIMVCLGGGGDDSVAGDVHQIFLFLQPSFLKSVDNGNGNALCLMWPTAATAAI